MKSSSSFIYFFIDENIIHKKTLPVLSSQMMSDIEQGLSKLLVNKQIWICFFSIDQNFFFCYIRDLN